LTVVNGNACYEIKVKDKECSFNRAFVFTPHTTTFIAVKHAGNIHIFNVKNDNDFSDDFKAYIDGITPSLMQFYDDRNAFMLRESFAISDEINHNNPHGFVVISPKKPPCDQLIALDGAKSTVRELNTYLHKKCPEFHLNIDYLTSFPEGSTVSLYRHVHLNAYIKPPLLLCLMHGDDCVSSITLKVYASNISIDSRTNERYEGRKFNTLLRAVAIMISKSLSERSERLTSCAENIISAMLMIKRFNAVSEGGDIGKSTISPDKLDKVIKDYFHHNGGIETHVELNDVNTANATAVFHETIQRMNCTPLAAPAGGKRKPKKTRKPKNTRKTMKTRKPKNTRKPKKTRKPMKTRKTM
jgi:hypothetical protein